MHPQNAAQQAYQFVISPTHLLVLAWLTSVGIAKMPVPTEKSKAFYTWVYGVLQVVGANLEKSTISLSATAAPVPPVGNGPTTGAKA
jgi:hypothetical protein